MRDELEAMIDKHTLHVVVQALIEICYEKAELVRANWQDEARAQAWERCASSLDHADYTIGGTVL